MTVLYRFVVELSTLLGVGVAGFLAYHDKSAWVWSWFLLYGFLNITYHRGPSGN